jgi:TPR repeat protein
MNAQSHGVTRDDVQPVAWYRKAADQGYVFAQTKPGRAAELRDLASESGRLGVRRSSIRINAVDCAASSKANSNPRDLPQQ